MQENSKSIWIIMRKDYQGKNQNDFAIVASENQKNHP